MSYRGKKKSCCDSSRKVFKACSKLAGLWAQQQQLSEQHLSVRVPEDGGTASPLAPPRQTCHLPVVFPASLLWGQWKSEKSCQSSISRVFAGTPDCSCAQG